VTEDGRLGTVAGLRRYPVKSMLGEDLRASDVTWRGLAGDRVLAVVHRDTGKVASAKDPRLWRGMLKLAATGSGPLVKITLPDGTAITGSDPGVDALLSGLLGQPVTLTATPPPGAVLDRADPEEVLRNGLDVQARIEVGRLGAASPEGTFFDFAPLHLMTTSTLGRVAGLSPHGIVELERYRPNIVIRTSAPGFGCSPGTTGSSPGMPLARSRAPESTPRFSVPARSGSATSCTRPEPARTPFPRTGLSARPAARHRAYLF